MLALAAQTTKDGQENLHSSSLTKPMVMTTHAMSIADEMSESLTELSGERLAWLILNNPVFKNLTDFSPEAILLTEVLSRLSPIMEEGYEACRFGWINHSSGQVIDYRHEELDQPSIPN